MKLSNEGMMLLSKIKVFLRREAQVQIDLIRFTREAGYAREMLVLASDRGDQDIVTAAFKLMSEIDIANVETARGASLNRSDFSATDSAAMGSNTRTAANTSRPSNFDKTSTGATTRAMPTTMFPQTQIDEGKSASATPATGSTKRYVSGLR
jgi:hypothetical protein